MNFENQNFLRKVLSKSEYRSLSNINKSLKRISDKKCSSRTDGGQIIYDGAHAIASLSVTILRFLNRI